MIDLSLLPKKEKNILLRERLYQFIAIALVIFLIGLSIVSLELSWAKQLLKNNFPSYDLSFNKNKEIVEKIRNINRKLQAIDKIQSNYLEISPILVAFSKIYSDNLQIKLFTIDQNKKEFQIKGWSKNRETLLNFKNELKNILLFKKTEAPLSNLLKRENIDFEFIGKIN